ncbi:MAG: hypothetical protein IT376_01575 [Polyangiaceae bacterium]|nr:hypothetical protein [Polyangiaceae bacterium]
MVACPRCGSANAPGAVVCGACAAALGSPRPRPGNATVVGYADPGVLAAAGAAAGSAPVSTTGAEAGVAPELIARLANVRPGERIEARVGAAVGHAGGDPRRGPERLRLRGDVPPAEPASERAPASARRAAGAPRSGRAPAVGPATAEHRLRALLRHRHARVIGGSIALTAVLAGGAAALALALRTDVSASSEIDAEGHDVVALECASCADGTTVSGLGASATFQRRGARLSLAPRHLEVGAQQVELQLTPPAGGRVERVTAKLAVPHRLEVDASTLTRDPPRLAIHVHGAPSTIAIVDGRSVPLDANGRGTHLLDVTAELEGPAETDLSRERRVPYSLQTASRATNGALAVHLRLPALVIEAPGDRVVTEGATFLLAGHTRPGGTVTVAGRPITVDAAGRFAQMMTVSAVGETTISVQAAATEFAPRVARVHVKRVASLEAEARGFRSTATTTFASIADADASKVGWAVALEGTVGGVERQDHSVLADLAITAGCTTPPCRARLVHRGPVALIAGERVIAHGHLRGGIPREGAVVPEIAVLYFTRSAAR